MLGGWAYGAIYRNSHERTAALDGWLWHYNHQRRHSALGHKPPERTNLLGTLTSSCPLGGSHERWLGVRTVLELKGHSRTLAHVAGTSLDQR